MASGEPFCDTPQRLVEALKKEVAGQFDVCLDSACLRMSLSPAWHQQITCRGLDIYMVEILNYVASVAEYFKSQLGRCLVDAYKMGSLSHGGFSRTYSDIDVGLILDCPDPPEGMGGIISGARRLQPEYGKRLSVFWGNPACRWGRLRILDRLDLLDHGVPLLNNRRAKFERPTRDEIRQALHEFVENSWKPKTEDLSRLSKLDPADRKPYIRCLL